MENILPPCVHKILNYSAYDSLNVLKELNEEKIVEIEKFISDNKDIVNSLECCHSEKYKQQKNFKFLPGHRAILLSVQKKILEDFESEKKLNIDTRSNSEFSVILNELIKSANINCVRSKNQSTYTDAIKYFCTYIYLLSGKSAYETLQRNLPIPSTKTICMYCIKYK